MPVATACAQTLRAISRARALFGPAVAPQLPGGGLAQAANIATSAKATMSEQSGALVDAHHTFTRRSVAVLTADSRTDTALATAVRDAAVATQSGAARLDTILARARAIAALAPSATSPAAERAILAAMRNQLVRSHRVVGDTQRHADRLSGEVQALTFGHGPALQGPQFGGDLPQEPPASADERRKNQISAFREVFGRDPVSLSDWTTAAGLDPHTYNPMFRGTESEVSVVRIKPVPGQGVVRSSQWIPDREVRSFPPWTHDLGNNRGPAVRFDPEDTKVTTIIDYENGIVVMRQNPSVMENDDGSPGEVRIGRPSGTVTQLEDGSVRIKYDAGNPFAPEWTRDPEIMDGHQVTVNGDLVFTPGANGVTVDGTRTNYPSMEVYQDMPDGTTRTVLIDNAAHGGQQGPMTNLPQHHDVGVGGKAFAPFDSGGWNPAYDVPTPLPGTAFGPPSKPPSASPPPSVGVPM